MTVATRPPDQSSQPVPSPTNTGNTSSTILQYPEKMDAAQDRIKFTAKTHTPKGLPDITKGFETVRPEYGAVPNEPTVFLPIQSSITDQNSVGWDPDTLNPIELTAVNASLKIMKSGSNVTKVAGTQFEDALMKLRQQQEGVRTYLAGQAIGVNNLLSRVSGKVLNPNLELLFQGPQLRPFNFTFKLSPRSESEAIIVKSIINFFKRNMSPIVSDQGLYVKAPNIFGIEYISGSSRHQSLNQIKECALTNCSVDYTPLGTYMTYEDSDKTMVSYNISLQFQEIEPVYSRDYNDKHPIGY